jgi:hypothetical protein
MYHVSVRYDVLEQIYNGLILTSCKVEAVLHLHERNVFIFAW